MSKEISQIHRPEAAVIPQLDDPKHPGMVLVSKITLFSLSLFLLLFVLLAVAGNNVMLNFELNATASLIEEHWQVTIDVQQASVFEPGDELSISYESGETVRATVTQMGTPVKGRLTMTVTVVGSNASVLSNSANYQNISLKVQQPLKDFIFSKLAL